MGLQVFENSSEIVTPVINSYGYEDELNELYNIPVLRKDGQVFLDRENIPIKLGINLVNFLKSKLNPAYENGFAFLTGGRLAEWSSKKNGSSSSSQGLFSQEEIIIGGHSHDGYVHGVDLIGETQLSNEFRSKRLVYYGTIEAGCELSQYYKGSNVKFIEGQTKVWLKWCPGIPSGSGDTPIDARYDMAISANKSLVVGFDYITLYFFNRIYAVYDVNNGNKLGDDIWYLPEAMNERMALKLNSYPQDNTTPWYTLVSDVNSVPQHICYNWWGEEVSCPLSLNPQQGNNTKEDDNRENPNSGLAANVKIDTEGRVILESYWQI